MKKQGGIFLILILALAGAGFFYALESRADGQNILINEIMYDAPSSDSNNEWLEIYNAGQAAVTIIEGSGTDSWRFNDGSNHVFTLIQGSLTLAPGGYEIIAANGEKFLIDHPDFAGTVIETVMSLNNISDTLKLSDDKGATFFGEITYQKDWGAAGNGYTLERQGESWAERAAPGGRPGAPNRARAPAPPPAEAEPGSNDTASSSEDSLAGPEETAG